jgi:hypothetical protein
MSGPGRASPSGCQVAAGVACSQFVGALTDGTPLNSPDRGLVVLFVSQPLQAGDDVPMKKNLPEELPGVEATAPVTVWLDSAPGTRKWPAANRMIWLRAEMASCGYKLHVMMPMNENGDTAGFWVTYRPAR